MPVPSAHLSMSPLSMNAYSSPMHAHPIMLAVKVPNAKLEEIELSLASLQRKIAPETANINANAASPSSIRSEIEREVLTSACEQIYANVAVCRIEEAFALFFAVCKYPHKQVPFIGKSVNTCQ
eukprot:6194556-Pleurochrysis_carterae.AAC.2